MTEETLKVFSRLKQTGDGIDFICYLEKLSKDNYEAFKGAPSEMNDIFKGAAIAIDSLIKVFAECDDKLSTLNSKQPEWGV